MSSQVVGTLYAAPKVCPIGDRIEPPRTEAAARELAGFHENRRAERPHGARFQPAARSSTRKTLPTGNTLEPPRTEAIGVHDREQLPVNIEQTKPPGRFTEAG